MNGADALVKCLELEGVEYVFGYPGVAIAPFFDSIYGGKITPVLVRQEQCAAHAASGYTRICRKTGVVAVTSGPGAENLITGIATAFADSIPMICITGQVDSEQVGGDVFQEADISGAVESFVKFSYQVRHADDIPRIVKEAFYIAGTGRKGPVLIDLPADVQKEELKKDFSYPEKVQLRTYKPTVEGHAVQIRKVIEELSRAKRPILCVGGGVHLSNAVKEVRDFAHRHNIPAVCTMMGLGVFPTEDPMFYGMVGNNGQKCGNRAMNDADMIIMAGCRVADRSISQPDLITANKVLVHIDVDPAEIGKNAGPSIPLVGDLKHVFRRFLASDFRTDTKEWIETLNVYRTEGGKPVDAKMYDSIDSREIGAASSLPSGEKMSIPASLEKTAVSAAEEEPSSAGKTGGVDPAAFLRELSLKMDPDAVYIADVGQNQLWSCANVVIRDGRFLTSGGMGTMGYAVPAAMGAKLADPARQVIAVCGDGGFQMTMMELATMRYYGIQAKIIVLKNRWLGLVRQYQHLSLHDRFTVTDLGDYPKLDKFAEAYEMDYLRVGPDADRTEAEEAIIRFLEDKSSVLMEVDISPDTLA